MIGLAAAVAMFTAGAGAGAGGGSGEAEPEGLRWLVTGAARTHPSGGIIGAEALVPQSGDIALGGFANYAYYWAELGAKLEWRHLGGFLIGGAWLGLEPGYFIPSAQPAEARRLGLRFIARGRLELNFKGERLWIYNRLTVEARMRSFAERDPYREAVLDEELSVEEAVAPLVKVLSWSEAGGLWLYGELTVAAEARFGLLDLRPSGGVIAEELLQGVTFDLDIYRSLREGPLEGWGALLFVWWRF